MNNANFLRTSDEWSECSNCQPAKGYFSCDLVFKEHGIKCKCRCHQETQDPEALRQEDYNPPDKVKVNRPIKFRAWDKKEKKMITNTKISHDGLIETLFNVDDSPRMEW